MIDGELVDTGFTNAQPQYWFNDIHDIALNVSSGEHTIDLFVDVIARTNWGGRWEHFNQQKGLPEITGSKIEINNIEIQGVEIIALEFTQAWVNGSVVNTRNNKVGTHSLRILTEMSPDLYVVKSQYFRIHYESGIIAVRNRNECV